MPEAARKLVASLVVGLLSALLCVTPKVRTVGADTVPGRYGAALFACRSSLDLGQVEWIANEAAALPYYLQRASDGTTVSAFGPTPAWFGAPFMDGLEPGAVLNDHELERRARHAAAVAVGLATMLLCAALSARTTAFVAAGLSLVPALSYAGVPTLGQGLWQQTVVVLPLMAAVATLAWATWRGGILLVLTPGLLLVTGLTRLNVAFLVLALGVLWLRAVLRSERRWLRVGIAGVMAGVLALPQLMWNAAESADPLGIVAYLTVHSSHGAGMHLSVRWFLQSLLGLLVSPARGLVIFAPVLLVGLVVSLRYGDRDSRILAAGIVLHILPVALYFNWWGGWVFGPRMVAETIWLAPLLVLPLPATRGLTTALVVACAVTVGVGLLGTFRYEIGAWELRRDPDAHNDALWDFVDSPLAAIVHGHAVTTRDAPAGPYLYCKGEPALRMLR